MDPTVRNERSTTNPSQESGQSGTTTSVRSKLHGQGSTDNACTVRRWRGRRRIEDEVQVQEGGVPTKDTCVLVAACENARCNCLDGREEGCCPP